MNAADGVFAEHGRSASLLRLKGMSAVMGVVERQVSAELKVSASPGERGDEMA